MADVKGPLDRAADRLGELVHLIKNNVIPGMRPKDQKAILSYLLEMVDDLIDAKKEIEDNRVTAEERARIESALSDEFSVRMDKKLEEDRIKWNRKILQSRQEVEARLREEFKQTILDSHLRNDD